MSLLELKVASGPKAGKTFVLSSGELVFGRTKGDVVIDWDGSTSSRHFKIEKQSDRFLLHDLGSTNGTFVNGTQITSVQVYNGDKVLAGSTLFTVHLLSPQPATQPVEPQYVASREVSIDFAKNFDPYAEVKTAPRPKPKPVESEPPKSPLTVSPKTVLRQVRLRIASDKEKGTVYWLGPGQTLVFGRTAKSDCCLDFDATLSSRHFSVTCHLDRCEIEDLESLAGTLLNGRNVTKDRLFDGDEVKAGLTALMVEVEGADGPVVRTGADAIAAASAASAPQVVTQASEATRFQCASGLTRIRGKLADPEAIISIFEVLQQMPTLYLLIDFARISLPLPEGVDIDTCKLFPWVPAIAAGQTPQLVNCDELPDWKAYVEEAWGSDALVGIQSALPKDELLTQLQTRLTESSHGPAAAQGIIGFCWPSVLESLLENNLHGFVERFIENTTLVLTEVAGDAESWQTYSNEEPTKFLKTLKVKLIDSEPKM